ncbi:MAG: guanylate kinase [Xanthomonadaceae bacterium]|nr:guanylate kinase [Xanthomonadaceae bacterium]MDE2084424.1 guanylate kinase [Xanthomonadaceae bacterium]MDE2257041.1 guanylate kinase [Xanthomonadaceae bacterium]
MTGTLFIVAAPSGAGKTSLTRALLAGDPNLLLSVSYTSRAPRPNEIDGVHYHFVSRDEFEAMIARGEFFEHAVVHGDLKGTSRTVVEQALTSGRDVLLEIDWQGARTVRAQMPDAVGIFILPPSREELERRLRTRASDSEATIRRRLADAHADLAHATEFDYTIVNDNFDAALEQLREIVTGCREGCALPAQDHSALLARLLNST